MYRIGQEEIDAVARTLLSKDFFKVNNSGQEVMHFETEWKETVGSEYCLLMTSGFGAITSALIGLGIGPGDEVIVPGYTYIATALAVTAVGAIPVIADIDETLTIDVADVEQKITKHTKAVIPVHIQGFPCNMDGLCALADKYGIAIVEDACQADGGEYHGRYLGTIGTAGAFSFNYYKIITAGEGGALVTNDRRVYERALIYHDSSAVAFFGNQMDGVTETLFGGTEFRISDVTGAILREQLKKLPGILGDLRNNKKKLIALLNDQTMVAPSHDSDGDCGTTLALRFESAEACESFRAACEDAGMGVTVPINTGKHVYTNWTPIMDKKGALHPAMDPFLMKENQGLQMDYTMDMCPGVLDLLTRTAYVSLHCDWDEGTIKEVADIINAALK